MDDRGHIEATWNYTVNTNGMIEAVLDDAGIPRPVDTRPCTARDPETGEWKSYPNGFGRVPWYYLLDGQSGPSGAALLKSLADGLDAEPGRFDAMNPPNGWGTREGLVDLLRSMIRAVPEWPCTWHANG